MRVVRAADHRRMRWKNGLGETIEFAIAPHGATLDDFDWRLSRAGVDRSGPFSLFPGCDRTLCVIDGGPLALHVEGQPRVTLDADSAPYSFAADVPAYGTVTGAPVNDLNLIWRRDQAAPLLVRHRGQVRARAMQDTLILISGDARLEHGNTTTRLGANDLIVCARGDDYGIVADAMTPIYVIDLPKRP